MLSVYLFIAMQVGFANWNPDSVHTANNFQVGVDNLGFTDTYESSFWGSIKSSWFRLKRINSKTLNVPEAFRNPLPITYYKQRKKIYERTRQHPGKNRKVREYTYKTQRRPLIIYIPGIYNNPSSGQPRRAYQRFKEAGYHFIALPNPWSTSYIKANPYGAKPGDVLHEAYSLRIAIDKAIALIGKKHISNIELVGASYGAFVAAVIQAFEPKESALFTSTTIISPPLDFRYTIPFLDEQMLSINGQVEDLKPSSKLKIFINYLFAGFRTDIDEKYLKKAKPYTIQFGFKDGLLTAVKTYAEVHGLDWIPNFDTDEERKKWEEKLVFTSYFKTYAPELLRVLQSEFAFLHYWIQAAQTSGYSPRVITAQDDFLNPEFFPTKMTLLSYPENIFLRIPEGGHLGFLAFPWYDGFYQTVWKDIKKSSAL